MTLTAMLRRDDEPGGDTAQAVPETSQAARAAEQPAALPPGHAITTSDGDRVNALDQVIAVIRHAFRTGRRQAKDMSGREGGWVNGVLAGRPPSVSGQRDYTANRRWLPPGHEGGIADREGEAYQVAIGIPGVALGNMIAAVSARQFRFLIAFGLLLGAVFTLTQLAGWTPEAGVLLAAAMFAVLAAYVGLAAALLAARRAFAKWRAGRFPRHPAD
jgi:hypothetical protein